MFRMSSSPSSTSTERPQPDLSTLLHTFLNPTSPYLHRLSNPSLSQRFIQQLAVLKFVSTLPNPSVERSIRDWAFQNIPVRPEGRFHGTGPTLSLLEEVIANIKKAVQDAMKILSEKRQVGLEKSESPNQARVEAMEMAKKILGGLDELMEDLRRRYEFAHGDLGFRECK